MDDDLFGHAIFDKFHGAVNALLIDAVLGVEFLDIAWTVRGRKGKVENYQYRDCYGRFEGRSQSRKGLPKVRQKGQNLAHIVISKDKMLFVAIYAWGKPQSPQKRI